MDPQLHAQSIIELDACLGRSLSQHAVNARQFDKHIHHCGWIFRCDQDIQVADGVAHPSQAAAGLRVDDSLHFFELGDQRLGDREGAPQRDADRPARERCDPLEDRGFALGAHTRKGAQFAFLGGGFQLGKSCDVQRLPDHGGALRSQPGDRQPFHQTWRDFLFEFFQESQFSRAQKFIDLFGDGFSHARDLLQLSLFPVFGSLPSQIQQAVSGFAVGKGLVDDSRL